jgi:uncharacterized membrane protein YsdA (DUF1294 family)/cold shock CspA family protein
MLNVRESSLTARIVDWDAQKGYGFLEVGKGKLFLHHRDFAEHHKRPAVGDVIRFTVGLDAQGRTCAKNAAHINDGGRLTVLAILWLLCLLVLPAIALYRYAVDYRWAALYGVVLGLISYACYAIDKRRARDQAWRIPENILHLTELLGGWPGAFLAQRRFRHKVSKLSYQLVFWFIVLAYQFAAYDSLQNWRLSRAIVQFI